MCLTKVNAKWAILCLFILTIATVSLADLNCVPIDECLEFKHLINKTVKSAKEQSFLARQQCDGQPGKVVCTTLPHNILPPRGECGKTSSNRIVGGYVTDIDELPWNCLIEYDKGDNTSSVHCSCVLINRRYVLTASHCVNGKKIPAEWNISHIHLGEWDLDTDPDCLYTDDCAPLMQRIPVEKVIPHQQFIPSSVDQHNDIALIRLAYPVTLNDFVKPICLPVDPHLHTINYTNFRMMVSGWGVTETKMSSSVEMKAILKGVSQESCSSCYAPRRNIWEKQICAMGKNGGDSCKGDSGGGLISWDRSDPKKVAAFLVGLVSYGPTPCGFPGWPGVYTRMSEYIDWIQDEMEE